MLWLQKLPINSPWPCIEAQTATATPWLCRMFNRVGDHVFLTTICPCVSQQPRAFWFCLWDLDHQLTS